MTAPTPSEKPFSRDTRLRRRSEFDHLRKAGRRQVGRYCVLIVADSLDGHRRVSIINSRRFSTKAVVRNRARRLLREAYRLLFPRLKPAWILLIPRRYLLRTRMPPVYDELGKLCSRAGILSAEDVDAKDNECRANGAEPR